MNDIEFQKYVMANFGRQGHGAHTEEQKLAIAGLGLGGEAGETQEHIKKFLRDGRPLGNAFLLEAGDTLHYLTYLLGRAGYTLADAMAANVEKLDKRFA